MASVAKKKCFMTITNALAYYVAAMVVKKSCITMANTLAYYVTASVAKERSFIAKTL